MPRIVNDESHPIVVLRHRMVSNQKSLPFPSNAFEIGHRSRLRRTCFLGAVELQATMKFTAVIMVRIFKPLLSFIISG